MEILDDQIDIKPQCGRPHQRSRDTNGGAKQSQRAKWYRGESETRPSDCPLHKGINPAKADQQRINASIEITGPPNKALKPTTLLSRGLKNVSCVECCHFTTSSPRV